MTKPFKTILMAVTIALATAFTCAAQLTDAITLTSPNGQLVMKFALVNGAPNYSLDFNGQAGLSLRIYAT